MKLLEQLEAVTHSVLGDDDMADRVHEIIVLKLKIPADSPEYEKYQEKICWLVWTAVMKGFIDLRNKLGPDGGIS